MALEQCCIVRCLVYRATLPFIDYVVIIYFLAIALNVIVSFLLGQKMSGLVYKILQKGGEKVNITERRWKLLKLLCKRRYDKISNLAIEFGVSERTIRRDIEALSLYEPIYTMAGRYSGGVYVVEGYYFDSHYFDESQKELLESIIARGQKDSPVIISSTEIAKLCALLKEYSKPQK